MSIIATTKNLRTLVANSQALNIGTKKVLVVASWIMNGELSYMNSQILTGSDEQAEEIIEVVAPIIAEAQKLGYEMDGLPASTLFQARVLWSVAGTLNQAKLVSTTREVKAPELTGSLSRDPFYLFRDHPQKARVDRA